MCILGSGRKNVCAPCNMRWKTSCILMFWCHMVAWFELRFRWEVPQDEGCFLHRLFVERQVSRGPRLNVEIITVGHDEDVTGRWVDQGS